MVDTQGEELEKLMNLQKQLNSELARLDVTSDTGRSQRLEIKEPNDVVIARLKKQNETLRVKLREFSTALDQTLQGNPIAYRAIGNSRISTFSHDQEIANVHKRIEVRLEMKYTDRYTQPYVAIALYDK